MRAALIIGIDPHKMPRTANAVDSATNTTAASLRVDASLAGYRELLRWAKQFPERRCAVENARGLGRHLARWLVTRGEVALDVPSSALTSGTTRHLFRDPPEGARCPPLELRDMSNVADVGEQALE